MYGIYATIFWIALALAIGSLVAAAFFFVKDRIWEVVEYLRSVKSGMRSASLRRRRSSGGAAKNMGYAPQRNTSGRVNVPEKPTGAMPRSEQETTDLNSSPDMMETVDLNPSPDSDETLYMDDTPDSMETTFISTPSETMETTFIDDEQETIGTIAISDDEAADADKPADFQITEKQVLIFSNEVIA